MKFHMMLTWSGIFIKVIQDAFLSCVFSDCLCVYMSYHRIHTDKIGFYVCFDEPLRHLCSCTATGTWNIGKVVQDHGGPGVNQDFAES